MPTAESKSDTRRLPTGRQARTEMTQVIQAAIGRMSLKRLRLVQQMVESIDQLESWEATDEIRQIKQQSGEASATDAQPNMSVSWRELRDHVRG